LIERTRAEFGLGETARDAGYTLLALDEVPSTNDVALARAREEGASRLWVVARRQTSGRGRHGRSWASPPGNLYASLVLIDPCEVARAPELGFVTGVAVFEAMRASTGLEHPRLSLKWPNDLLIDGAKCVGILLEGHRLGNSAFALVIGMGVNITASPPEFPGATSLSAFLMNVTAPQLFTLLADEFARRFAAFATASHSDEAQFAEWAGRAHGVGSLVRVKLPTGEVRGTFRGLERGRMIVDTQEGIRKLDAGDLYVMGQGEASHPAPR
jgi:BirA family biotin operon repressor/biotin-[acetyl-CoA-carboxylase] ligase